MMNKILLFILIFIFWRVIIPGNHLASDLHTKSNIELSEQFSFPLAWSDSGSVGLGHYKVPLLWNWPVNFIFGLFSELGINYNFMLLIFGYLVAFSLVIYGVNSLLKYYKIGQEGRIAGILLFLLNSYFILLIDGGQLNLAMAYGALPVAFYYFLKAISYKSKVIESVKFGLSAYLLSVFDIRIIFILLILIGLNFVFVKGNIFSRIKKYVIVGIIAGLILLVFHWYWIYPSLFLKAPSLPGVLGRVSQVEFLNFVKFKHAVALLQPHWYLNDFGQVARFRKIFLLIPIYLGAIILFKLKNRNVLFWTSTALVFIFLTKGNNPPFGDVYEWLFLNFPGFSFFRDSSKFYFGIAFTYSILIGFATDSFRIGILKKMYAGLFIVFILILIYPVWMGKMTGTFRVVQHESEYGALNQQLEQDNEFGKVLWLPSKAPLGYSAPKHQAIEMTDLAINPLFNLATVGKYESFNFLREGNYISDLLDIYGVRYIVYPEPSELKHGLSEDEIIYYDEFSAQINKLGFIEKKISEKPISAFKLKNNQDLFFVANKKWQVVGDGRILNELADSRVNLSKNIINFTELGLAKANLNDQFILFEKEKTDLFFSLSDKSNFVYPANNMGFEPDFSGWWKREHLDGVWWRDFLEQKYGIYNADFDFGKGWAVSEGRHVYRFVAPKSGALGIRLLSGTRGGVVEVGRTGEAGAKIATKFDYLNPIKIQRRLSGNSIVSDQIFEYDPAFMKWVYGILMVNKGEEIEIRTEGELNVINLIAIVEQSEWEEFNKNYENMKVYDWMSDKQEILSLMQVNDEASIKYQRISPVKYKVSIDGLKKGELKYLVFSQNFDAFWELNGQKSQSVYGGLNGFEITQNGEYDLYYSAQDWVNKGFVISVFGFILVLGFLVYDYKRI